MPINLKTPLAETWKRRLDRWQQSGLSAAVFAKQEKVSEPRLYTWRKRFADTSLAPKALALAAPTKAATSGFVPVKIKPTPAPAAASAQLIPSRAWRGMNRTRVLGFEPTQPRRRAV